MLALALVGFLLGNPLFALIGARDRVLRSPLLDLQAARQASGRHQRRCVGHARPVDDLCGVRSRLRCRSPACCVNQRGSPGGRVGPHGERHARRRASRPSSASPRRPYADPRHQDADAGAHPGPAARYAAGRDAASTGNGGSGQAQAGDRGEGGQARPPSSSSPMALCFFPVIFVALLGPAVSDFAACSARSLTAGRRTVGSAPRCQCQCPDPGTGPLRQSWRRTWPSACSWCALCLPGHRAVMLLGVQITPSRRPASTASARDATSSLRIHRRTCVLRVLRDTYRAAAISRYVIRLHK